MSKVSNYHLKNSSGAFVSKSQLIRYDPASRLALAQVADDPWILRYRKDPSGREADL